MRNGRLRIEPWRGPPPDAARFAEGPVLHLGGGGNDDWLAPLRADLEAAGRLFSPALSTLAGPGPDPDRNPWAFRPDDFAPLRWGDPAEDVRELGALSGSPETLHGVVVDSVLQGLAAQPARMLLKQVGERLVCGAPWILLERNGASLPEVARSLRRSPGERGEGRSTLRSASELRRLVEVVGLGIEAVHGLGPPGIAGRVLRRAGAGAAAPWLLFVGRRA